MKLKQVFLWLGLMLIILVSAAIGYSIILDVSFLDALYMTIITISTVGYKEVTVMNNTAKWFTIVFIIISVGMFGFLLKGIINFFSEGDVREYWRIKKMEKVISELTDHYIICGMGETGINVVKHFNKRHVDFVVIENDPEKVKDLDDLGVLYILGDANKEEILQKAQIEKAKGLITTLATDAENVFIVLTSRQLNKDLHIISRFHDKSSERKLILAGANKVVSPDEIGGKKMAQLMISPQVQLFVDNIIDAKNMSINMEEVSVRKDSDLAGKKLREADISNKVGLIVLAIRREEEKIIFNPKADELLNVGDRLIVVGSREQIIKIKELALDI
ncbi:MAG: potassium channel protein [Candidatus Izimaplasma sp.]|nr:potassium channel protein [Candidatus Izimaplasma bacterium]